MQFDTAVFDTAVFDTAVFDTAVFLSSADTGFISRSLSDWFLRSTRFAKKIGSSTHYDTLALAPTTTCWL